MELKSFQKDVLNDIEDYYVRLRITGSPSSAYEEHWRNKGYTVGKDGIKYFSRSDNNTSRICIKVPTGGGKTFIATCSIKKYYDVFPKDRMAVVWLVPSDAILEQTLRNLKNPDHPYRQRLNSDFSNNVEVYDVEEMLTGQNFSPTILSGQLSIFVLTYSVLKSKTKKDRRVNRVNTVMQNFHLDEKYRESPVEGADPDSVMVGLYDLSPLVILDESHNAGTELSTEMLSNLNPSMIFEMTATPLKESNLISYVSAGQLKKENMVKIPVILYKREDPNDVYATSIGIRNALEVKAKEEEAQGGLYIRPIVLFQAQPKNAENMEEYGHIKNVLINEFKIPEEQIAIKVSGNNEIKNIDLLSRTCPIRYIITINALKEGWDCPFAYVLASLANKSSSVDVQQIVGRILRQPYAVRSKQSSLNTSYVLTSSDDFHSTIRNVGLSLVNEGFSEKDYRIGSISTLDKYSSPDDVPVSVPEDNDGPAPAVPSDRRDNVDPGDPGSVPSANPSGMPTPEQIIENAGKIEEEVKEKTTTEENGNDGVSTEEFDKYMKKVTVKPEFTEDIGSTLIPRLLRTKKDGFSDDMVKVRLEKDDLFIGFQLSKFDRNVSFEFDKQNIGVMDVDKSGQTLNYQYMDDAKKRLFDSTFQQTTDPNGPEVDKCVRDIVKLIKEDCIPDKDMIAYVSDVIHNMSIDDINYARKNVGYVSNMFTAKFDNLRAKYYKERFNSLVKKNQICADTSVEPYKFPSSFVLKREGVPFAKSLYSREEAVDGFEAKALAVIDSSPNVKWWHRIASRKDGEFFINGFINHYPDFVVMTNSGVIIFIESKGKQLANQDSADKIELGRIWSSLAGSQKYKYYMVFESKDYALDGAISFDELKDYINGV